MFLALDIGNVLVNQDMNSFIKAVSKQMNISKSEAQHFVSTIQKQQDLGITSITDALINHFKIKSEFIIEDLVNEWNLTINPNRQSIDFFNFLIKRENIQVALLSNIGFEHEKLLNEKLHNDLVYNKSIHFFSCNVGVRKPTKLYYNLFLNMYPEFKNALYIDDLNENLNSGSEAGLFPFHFDLSKNNNSNVIINLNKILPYFINDVIY